METWTKTCGPIAGLILTQTHLTRSRRFGAQPPQQSSYLHPQETRPPSRDPGGGGWGLCNCATCWFDVTPGSPFSELKVTDLWVKLGIQPRNQRQTTKKLRLGTTKWQSSHIISNHISNRTQKQKVHDFLGHQNWEPKGKVKRWIRLGQVSLTGGVWAKSGTRVSRLTLKGHPQ